ncbi:hypothetical protein CXF83_15135 [Shewanella sp. Choline-02u-19]|uniref:hypothetical protein n=1 Tax=unclassified Shewanella TaxID=196818 RepID=UPI000C3208D4|nr:MULTISPECIES: hypothetical protein [unclassified Shewanella]PKH56543.1 hypothetical protein CXF84_13210 [Shewanella sp. Bg11-22]PKI27951.1 hypothetical protein CXF83_15135 [Shewanella sp. Choline-02u-19]
MILARVQTTPRQRDEFRLLVAIRFACLMAQVNNHSHPMDCSRVQNRTAKLEKHLTYNHPSPAFEQQFINCVGQLGNSFSLRYTEPKQGITGTVTVWANSPATNLYPFNPQAA